MWITSDATLWYHFWKVSLTTVILQLSNALYEQDVNEDLSKLAKLKSSSASSSNNSSHQNSDAYIEDSRLCLDKRWFLYLKFSIYFFVALQITLICVLFIL